MNTEVFELVMAVIGTLFIGGALMYLYINTFIWPETKIGKLQSENKWLKEQTAQYKLDNDLLNCQVETLIGMLNAYPEDSADE